MKDISQKEDRTRIPKICSNELYQKYEINSDVRKMDSWKFVYSNEKYEGSVITDYQFEQNTYSDSQFFKDSMNRQEKAVEQVTVITDGAYCGKENHDMAAEKNIRLVNTDLSGRPVDDILADFEFDESGMGWKRYHLSYGISIR